MTEENRTEREPGTPGRATARLHLPGHGTAPAEITVIPQARGTRLTRALLSLIGSWLLIPLVFFIPPHFPWVLAAFGGGLYLAWRFWRGELYVASFEGSCPRCGTALELKEGARIRRTQTLECYGCHRQPELIVDAGD